jgi:hypothetical protein
MLEKSNRSQWAPAYSECGEQKLPRTTQATPRQMVEAMSLPWSNGYLSSQRGETVRKLLVLSGILLLGLVVRAQTNNEGNKAIQSDGHNLFTVELGVRNGYVEEVQPLPQGVKPGDEVRYHSSDGDVQIDFSPASPFAETLIADSTYHTVTSSDGNHQGRCYITASDGTLYKYSELNGGTHVCTGGGNQPVVCTILVYLWPYIIF